jgi:elongation factor 1 alpha-like protein
MLESQSSQRRGGLLGGSSKTSKLAALAASRKKKNEEKKQPHDQPTLSTELDRAVGLLDKLGKRKSTDASVIAENKSWKTSSPDSFKTAIKDKQTEEASPEIEKDVQTPQDLVNIRHCSAQHGEPTPFAQTLFGYHHKMSTAIKFSRPYVNNPKFISANPFAKPSPDDIVLAAQSKGSWNT